MKKTLAFEYEFSLITLKKVQPSVIRRLIYLSGKRFLKETRQIGGASMTNSVQ